MEKRIDAELFINVNCRELTALGDGDEIWIVFFMTSDQCFDKSASYSSA